MGNLTRILDARVVPTNAYEALFALDWLRASDTHITSNDQKGGLVCADEALDTETGQNADQKDSEDEDDHDQIFGPFIRRQKDQDGAVANLMVAEPTPRSSLVAMTDADWKALRNDDGLISDIVLANVTRLGRDVVNVQNLDFGGLADPVMFQMESGKIPVLNPDARQLIQIFHTGHLHWVCVYIEDDIVTIFDGLGSGMTSILIKVFKDCGV